MGYCPVCGTEVTSPVEVRFGETFCSMAHAEEFVEKVRATRIQAAATLSVQTPEGRVTQPDASTARVAGPRDWRHYAKMGACIGAPLLAVVFLLGGGGALLGVAGGLLPILAFLACPLAMYFLMRSMARMEHRQKPPDAGKET